jgi:hypothetical protein
MKNLVFSLVFKSMVKGVLVFLVLVKASLFSCQDAYDGTCRSAIWFPVMNHIMTGLQRDWR